MHVMTEMTRMRSAQSFLGACLLALAGATLVAGEVWAQPASGYYLSQEIGLNVAPPMELFGNTNDRPSRCDEFINPRFAEVAGCTDPDRGLGAGWKTDYGRAAGMLAGVSAGYRFGGRVRVEAEWFHRESEYDRTSLVASATGDTFDKLGGEIQRAEVRVGSISSHNVFANVYIDFPGASRVTPYVGAGIGMGLVEMDYGDLWTRNPDPAAIVTAAGLPNGGGDSPHSCGHHNHQPDGAARPADGVPGAGRRRLCGFGAGFARRQGPLGSLRSLRCRGNRMGAAPEPRVAVAAGRQRAGDVPDPV